MQKKANQCDPLFFYSIIVYICILFIKIKSMITPIKIPLDLILFIVACICLYAGFREIKKHKIRKKKAFNRINEFGIVENKWGYIDFRGYQYISFFFILGISCILAVLYHYLIKYSG